MSQTHHDPTCPKPDTTRGEQRLLAKECPRFGVRIELKWLAVEGNVVLGKLTEALLLLVLAQKALSPIP